MKARPRTLVGPVLVGLLLAACAVPGPSAPVRPLGPGEVRLPTARWELNGQTFLCAGVGFVDDYVLRGSTVDPRITWMVRPDGSRMDIAWPPGYSARFVPDVEVLDDTANVIAREGTRATGGCGTAEPGISLVEFTTPVPDSPEAPMTAEP